MSIINRSVTYPGVTNSSTSPFDPSGWIGATSDPDTIYASVIEQNPSGINFVGRFTVANTAGFSQFNDSSDVATLIGEDLYASILLKPVTSDKTVRIRYGVAGGAFKAQMRINISTGSVNYQTGSGMVAKVTPMSDGYKLIETMFTANSNESYNFLAEFVQDDPPFTGSSYTRGADGDNALAQATFFGIASEFPGVVTTGQEPVLATIRNSVRSTIRYTNTF